MKQLYIFIFFSLIFSFHCFGQDPVANFSVDKTVGCGTIRIKFSNLSTGATSYEWDFGNGYTSIDESPKMVFPNTGTFDIRLIAKYGTERDTIIKYGLITSFQPPTSNYSAQNYNGCVPLDALFTDASVKGSAPINAWFWDFGDGASTSTEESSHTYNRSGSFQVSLTVTDTNGCSDTKVESGFVNVDNKPTASFKSIMSEFCEPPATVSFTSTSTLVGTEDHSFQWSFGNGINSTIEHPSAKYTTKGSFDVTLIVGSPNGCKDTLTKPSFVEIGVFKPNFITNDTLGCAPMDVSFTDLNGHSGWEWDFGDGNTSNSKNPTNTYQNSGTYSVKLKSTNTGGCTDSTTITQYIQVENTLAIDFSADNTIECVAPFTVTFTDNTPDATAWSWNFGDGNTSTDSSVVSNTYTSDGNYTVSLNVTNTIGCIETLTKDSLIKVGALSASINSDLQRGCVSLDVDFSDFTQDIISWEWDFGDGNNGTGQNITHTYSDTGVFDVSLITKDINNCNDTIEQLGYIMVGELPIVDFWTYDSIGCHELDVEFYQDCSNNTKSWQWFFGDTLHTESQEEDPLFTYTDTGYFNVELVASHYGCNDTLIKSQFVEVLPPKPLFEAVETDSCDIPFTACFISTTQGADTLIWNFGDSTKLDTIVLTQNDTIPDTIYHTYTDYGLFDVELYAINGNGCRDTLERIDYIRLSIIEPNFTVNDTNACMYNGLEFSNTSTCNTSIVGWEWDFGDNSTSASSGPVHEYDSSGIYSVKMVVRDEIGCKDSITDTSLVTIWGLPSPRFVTNDTIGCVPFQVSFNESSFPFDTVTIDKWEWNYGDGSAIDTLTNPTHLYESRGQYTVSLKITDDFGCDSTLTITNYIQPSIPHTYFSITSDSCHYNNITFNNTTTGNNVTYLWDFGDDSTSTEILPEHKYSTDTSEVFTIILTATDTFSCDSSFIKTINISHPRAIIAADTTICDCPEFQATFIDSSFTSSPEDSIVYWQWQFDDPTSGTNIAYLKDPTHTFDLAGYYDITLTVGNTLGCYDTLKQDSFIFVNGPYGSFDFSPKSGCTPLTVTFTANCEKTVKYEWIFMDGAYYIDSNNTTGQSVVTHTYSNNAELATVTPYLYIEDKIDETIPNDSVCIVPIPKKVLPSSSINFTSVETNFYTNKEVLCNPNSIEFYDVSELTNDSVKWYFGDGDSLSSTSITETHTYDTTGVFDIILVSYLNGCEFPDTAEKYIKIFQYPSIHYSLSDNYGCTPLSVGFTVDSIVPNTDTINSWYWDFDDNNAFGTTKNTEHIYDIKGDYTIVLTPTFKFYDTECNNHPYRETEYLEIIPLPIPDFYSDTNNVYESEMIFFTNMSSHDSALTYLWDFGDGDTSTVANPVHFYTSPGEFDIVLKAFTNDLCVDSVSYPITIIDGINIPTYFSPNGDGINETLNVIISGYKEFTFTIFNRWGLILFETQNNQNRWDGRSSSGEEVPDGTYFYILNGTDYQDKAEQKKGFITVKR